jgi:hypothetical protein
LSSPTGICCCLVFRLAIRAGLQPRVQPAQSGHRPAERGSEAKGEATDLIAFAFAFIFLSALSAQKSHVKPPNLSKTRQTTHNKPNIFLAKLEI